MRLNLLVSLVLLGALLNACSESTVVVEAETVDAQAPVHSAVFDPPGSEAATVDAGAAPPLVARDQEPEKALKIGVIGPETGEGAEYGKSVLTGVLLAAEQFNASGGIDNRKIEVVHYDNKGDPYLTSDLVYEMIGDNVLAILAAPTGWSTFAPVHLVNRSQTIFFSVGTKRRIARSGPYVFRASLPDELATREVIEYSTRELGVKSYALVTSSINDNSLNLSHQFRGAVAASGGAIVVEADTYDTFTGQTDLSGAVDVLNGAIKGLGVEFGAIIYTGDASGGAAFARKVKASGISARIIGGEELHDALYLKDGGDAVLGSLLYSTYAPESRSPKTVKFVKDYTRANGTAPDKFVALAYDTFMVVAEAVRVAGSTRPSDVREALLGIKGFEGVTGEIGFASAGETLKQPFLYKVQSGKDGKEFVLLSRNY